MKIILTAINAKYIHSNLALYSLIASTPYPVCKKEYTINQGYVVLDENSEIVDWFDTIEEAEAYVEEMESE